MKIDFTKMHGCGNDFVIIDDRDKSVKLNHDQRIKIADRNFGVGCDQLIVLEPSKKADVFMRIHNPDGSEAQACGNATRCVAALLTDDENPIIEIETIERILHCSYSWDGIVSVNMGKAISYEEIDLGAEYVELGQAMSVNVGNPHCIFFVDDAEKINLEHWGPKVENHPLFRERTNVEFLSKNEDGYRVRVWERGAGITKACGSGAMAVAWALHETGERWMQGWLMKMDGGLLHIVMSEGDNLMLIGQTERVFEGTMEL